MDKTIRILYVIPELQIGGAEKQMLELIRGLDKKRYRVFVCPIWASAGLTEDFRSAGAEIVPVHKRSRFDLSFIMRLSGWIRQHSIDIVHTYLFTANTWGRLAASLAKVPHVVVSERSAGMEGTNAEMIVYRVVNRFLAPFCDIILANSHSVYVRMQQELWWKPRCLVIHNCVDTERFHMVTSSDGIAQIKIDLGIAPDFKVIGIVARISEEKDYPTFLQAMRFILNERSDIKVLIVGDGPLRTVMEELAFNLGIADHVLFVGAQPQIERYFFVMDVFVLTSLYEGLPNVILEAMACGKPVVATRVSGIPELVIDGETGYLIPVVQPKMAADAVLRIIQDPVCASRLGKNGRQRIESYFTADRMIQATQSIYENLLSNSFNDASGIF